MRSEPLLRGRRPRAWVVLLGLCAGATAGGVAHGRDDNPAPRVEARQPFIDEMIQKAWDGAKAKPAKVASDEEYLRRVYLDILGRTPSIKETLAFLQSKESGKRQKLVDYLLEHPDAAKNFANQWGVLLLGRQRQERRVDRDALADWLRRQYLENRPWDRVAFDLITSKGSNKENGAVNFPMAHLESGAVPLTSITTRLFLGKQIQCTQCHDHPSNDWKQADFWSINAFFKGVRQREVSKADPTGLVSYDHTELRDEPTAEFSQYSRRNGLMGIAFPRFLDGRKISQGTDVDRRLELGKFVADPGNLDLARAYVNRAWGHFLGRGFVHPVDDFGPQNPPSHPELLDRLAREFQKSGYDMKALVRWITASRVYNLSSVTPAGNEKDDALFTHMALKPMTPEQLFDSLLTATSAHRAGGGEASDRKRQRWLDQFVFAFANDEGDEGTSFQGTIPQALMMMNGELMDRATKGQSGSFLADLLADAQRQSRGSPVAAMVNNLYLAALSRYPTRAEMATASRYLNSYPDTIGVLQDLFWALLNSNEFVLNR